MNAPEGALMWLNAQGGGGATIVRQVVRSLVCQNGELREEVRCLRHELGRLARGVPFGVTDEEWGIIAELRAVFS